MGVDWFNQSTLLNPQNFFGSDLKLWINGTTNTNKNGSGIFNAKLGNFVTDDSNGWALTRTATNKYPFFNGECIYVEGQATGTEYKYTVNNSDFKFLHDGSPWTIAFRGGIVRSIDYVAAIINTGQSTADVGIHLNYDNRSSQSRTHALVITLLRGAAGQPVQASVVINNFFTVGSFTDCIITYNGTSLIVYKNNTQVSSTNDTLANSSANHTYNLTFFRMVNNSTYLQEFFFKQILFVGKVVSSTERTFLTSFMAQGTETFTKRGTAKIYGAAGQSNMRGNNGTADATWASVSSYIGTPISVGAGITDTYEFVDHYGTGSGQFGPDLPFAYEMKQFLGYNIFIAKQSEGATPLHASAIGNDWNVTTLEWSRSISNSLIYAGKYAKYRYGMIPELRGLLWRQGEQDAQDDNANYTQEFQDLIHKIIADSVAAGWYTTIKLRVVAASIDSDFSPPFTYRDSIVTQTQDALDDYLTAYPADAAEYKGGHYFSTAGIPLSDGTHFTVPGGMKTVGENFAAILKLYVNE